MTQPPAPPPDPDAGLTDDEKAHKAQFKAWFKEGFTETVAELRAEAEKDDDAPDRTKKPPRSDWFGNLFGKTGGSS